SVENVAGRFTMIMFAFMPISACTAVFFVRRQLLKCIRKLQSSSDRRNQKLILRSLTAQVLLPLTTAVAISFWIADLIGVLRSDATHRLVLTLCSIFTIGSPLINLYYLPAYRRF
ncbi:hypothetical protein PFISCL1PPCAC_13811, partial [Pristionchus fissidentatus]